MRFKTQHERARKHRYRDNHQMTAAMVAAVEAQLEYATDVYPDDDYCGRLYRCTSCDLLDMTVAPAIDLIDGYPCPQCGTPSRPVSPLLEPGGGIRQ